MPAPSPAEVILSAMPSQGRAFETALAEKRQNIYDKERRAKEAMASIDKMFTQMKEFGEEQDITNLSNAFSSSKDPDAIEAVLNQTPTRTAKGAEFKIGLIQKIQQARESNANIEQSKTATEANKLEIERRKATMPIEIEESGLRRDLAKFNLTEAQALAPMARDEAKKRGLLLDAQVRGAAAAATQSEWQGKVTREEWAADKTLRDAKRAYETFELTFDTQMKKLQQTQATTAAAAIQIKSQLASTPEGRKLFGPADGLGTEDRMALYNKLIGGANVPLRSLLRTEAGANAQAEIMSIVAGLAATDADVRAAQFQRSEAVRNTIAQRFLPEAQRMVINEAKRRLDDAPQLLASPTPQAFEQYIASLRQSIMANMGYRMPKGDDATLDLFGVKKNDVWNIALSAALDQYENNLSRRVRTMSRAKQISDIEQNLPKMIPAGASPEQIQQIRAKALQDAGIDPSNPLDIDPEDMGNVQLDFDGLEKAFKEAGK